jgi:hypothetical protein
VTKKQIKESAGRYKKCYEEILNALPSWRQRAIREDIADRKNSGLLTDFVRMVIEAAEREESKPVFVEKNIDKKQVVNK